MTNIHKKTLLFSVLTLTLSLMGYRYRKNNITHETKNKEIKEMPQDEMPEASQNEIQQDNYEDSQSKED